jgi:hypothetical protein
MRRAEPTRRRVLVHKYKEAWPTYEVNSSERVDFRMFMLIRKVEMTELFPRLSEQGAVKDPVFLPPAFCGGIKALCDHLNDRKNAYRKAMMLEIGEVARRVATCLTLVPAIKRGRR